MTDEIIKLIDELPGYISYIYPGFLTIWLYCFLRGNRFNIGKYVIMLSVGISFMYIVFAEYVIIPFVNEKLNIGYINSSVVDIKFNIILFIMAVFVPYIINLIVGWNKIDEILKKMCIQTSVRDNEFDVLQDYYKNAIFITVYIKNTNLAYSGYMMQKEMDKDSRRFICLWKYRKFEVNQDTSLKKVDDHIDDDKERVVIYYDDISHFEVANIDKQQ